MAARKFRSSTTIEYKVATTVNILLVGGGAGGNSTSGGNPGILILHLNYTLLPGSYDVIIGEGGAPNMNGFDTFFGDSLLLAQGGRILASEQQGKNNIINGIFLAAPVVASSSSPNISQFVVVDNSRNFDGGGAWQVVFPAPASLATYSVPTILDLCSEFDVCGTPLAQRGRDASMGGLGAYATPNTGSGGDGGFFAGAGGSGLVVIRNIREAENPMNCSLLASASSYYQSCYSSCKDQAINLVVRTSASVAFTADVVVDLLLVGGGAGGSNVSSASSSGAPGVIALYKNYLLKRGTYTFTVGGGGSINTDGVNTTLVSSASSFSLVARGGSAKNSLGNYSFSTYSYAETISPSNGTSNVTLAAGDVVNFCATFPALPVCILGARMLNGNASSNSGSGGGLQGFGGSGVIAIRNAVQFSPLPPLCQSMCREQCLSNQTFVCGPGQFAFEGRCTDCPRNTYRDMATSTCINCQKGFVTAAKAASSSFACKSWCLAAFRKETGVVRVDTFPKPYNGTTNVTASTAAAALSKV
jgi:hypothetical protein